MNNQYYQKIKSLFNHNFIIKSENIFSNYKFNSKENYILFEFGLPQLEYLDFDFSEHKLNDINSNIKIGFFKDNLSISIIITNNHEIVYNINGSNRFINTSLEQFLFSIYEFEFFMKEKNNKTKKEKEKLFQNFKNQIYSIDADIDEKGYYWGSFIEDFENGILLL